ncbi:MAG: hypothetical protein QME13_04890, partial [Thermoanaerobacteraceae bacterium]|nr:hypothetical protein [Thermoanaerobacteraceae bacterium]
DPHQEMLNKLAAAKVKTYRPEKRKRWLFRRMAGLLPQAQKDDWVRQRKKKKRVTWWTRADANLAVNLSRDFCLFSRQAGGIFRRHVLLLRLFDRAEVTPRDLKELWLP